MSLDPNFLERLAEKARARQGAATPPVTPTQAPMQYTIVQPTGIGGRAPRVTPIGSTPTQIDPNFIQRLAQQGIGRTTPTSTGPQERLFGVVPFPARAQTTQPFLEAIGAPKELARPMEATEAALPGEMARVPESEQVAYGTQRLLGAKILETITDPKAIVEEALSWPIGAVGGFMAGVTLEGAGRAARWAGQPVINLAKRLANPALERAATRFPNVARVISKYRRLAEDNARAFAQWATHADLAQPLKPTPQAPALLPYTGTRPAALPAPQARDIKLLTEGVSTLPTQAEAAQRAAAGITRATTQGTLPTAAEAGEMRLYEDMLEELQIAANMDRVPIIIGKPVKTAIEKGAEKVERAAAKGAAGRAVEPGTVETVSKGAGAYTGRPIKSQMAYEAIPTRAVQQAEAYADLAPHLAKPSPPPPLLTMSEDALRMERMKATGQAATRAMEEHAKEAMARADKLIAEAGGRQSMREQLAVAQKTDIPEYLPAFAGGPAFDKEVATWINGVRRGEIKIGRVSPVSQATPIQRVAEDTNLTGLHRFMRNADDLMRLDTHRLGVELEQAFKDGGIKEGTELAEQVGRVLDGELDPGKLPAPAQTVMPRLRQWWQRMAIYNNIEPQRRIREYLPHFAKGKGDEMLLPEIQAMFRRRYVPKQAGEPFWEKVREGALEDYERDSVSLARLYLSGSIRYKHQSRPLSLMGELLRDTEMPPATREYIRTWMENVIGTPGAFTRSWGMMLSSSSGAMAGFLEKLSPKIRPMNLINKLRSVEKLPAEVSGRRFLANVRGNIYGSALVAPGTVMQNMTQHLFTIAEVGPVWWERGVQSAAMARAGNKRLLKALDEALVIDPDIAKRIAGQVPDEIKQRIGDYGLIWFTKVETANRVTAFFAGFEKSMAENAKHIGKTMNEATRYYKALEAGRNLALKTQFPFGSADTPLWFQSELGRTFGSLAQFGPRSGYFLEPVRTAKHAATAVGEVAQGVGRAARGRPEAAKASFKRAREHFTDQTMKRMFRYIIGSEAIIQGGVAVNADLRPWIRPFYVDPDRPGIMGSHVYLGTFGMPIGPTYQLVSSALGTVRGQPTATHEFWRELWLHVPYGRPATEIAPKTLRETGGRAARELFSVREKPARTGLSEAIKWLSGQ